MHNQWPKRGLKKVQVPSDKYTIIEYSETFGPFWYKIASLKRSSFSLLIESDQICINVNM